MAMQKDAMPGAGSLLAEVLATSIGMHDKEQRNK
jgi:hypothetical protein